MVVAKQLIKSATSVAANYRAACRTRSPADFVSKISVVAEEADEAQFWLELTLDSQIASRQDPITAERIWRADSDLHSVTGHREEEPEKSRRPITTRVSPWAPIILALLAILAIGGLRPSPRRPSSNPRAATRVRLAPVAGRLGSFRQAPEVRNRGRRDPCRDRIRGRPAACLGRPGRVRRGLGCRPCRRASARRGRRGRSRRSQR